MGSSPTLGVCFASLMNFACWYKMAFFEGPQTNLWLKLSYAFIYKKIMRHFFAICLDEFHICLLVDIFWNWLYVKELIINAYVACYPRPHLYQQRKPDNWYLDWQLGSQKSMTKHAESLIFDQPTYIKDVLDGRCIIRRIFWFC